MTDSPAPIPSLEGSVFDFTPVPMAWQHGNLEPVRKLAVGILFCVTACGTSSNITLERSVQGLVVQTVSLPLQNMRTDDLMERYASFERRGKCLALRANDELFTPVFVNGLENRLFGQQQISVFDQQWNVVGGPAAEGFLKAGTTKCGTKFFVVRSARPAAEVRPILVAPSPPPVQ